MILVDGLFVDVFRSLLRKGKPVFEDVPRDLQSPDTPPNRRRPRQTRHPLNPESVRSLPNPGKD